VSYRVASPEGAFRIFDLSGPYPEVAYIDTPAGGLYVETDRVDRLILRYERIRQRSLEPSKSIEMIAAALDKIPDRVLETTGDSKL
jgi:hypothetical protein